MEKGFFHPSRGYWQTNNTPDKNIVDSYPKGTIEVPLKPGEYYEWANGVWSYVAPPAPSPEVLKAIAESNRQAAYTQEADPLFFQWQAGESTEAEWLAKRDEIRTRFPYPSE